jgi:hypothetical protein
MSPTLKKITDRLNSTFGPHRISFQPDPKADQWILTLNGVGTDLVFLSDAEKALGAVHNLDTTEEFVQIFGQEVRRILLMKLGATNEQALAIIHPTWSTT